MKIFISIVSLSTVYAINLFQSEERQMRTNTKVTGARLEKRILDNLARLDAGSGGGTSRGLGGLGLRLDFRRRKETVGSLRRGTFSTGA